MQGSNHMRWPLMVGIIWKRRQYDREVVSSQNNALDLNRGTGEGGWYHQDPFLYSLWRDVLMPIMYLCR